MKAKELNYESVSWKSKNHRVSFRDDVSNL